MVFFVMTSFGLYRLTRLLLAVLKKKNPLFSVKLGYRLIVPLHLF